MLLASRVRMRVRVRVRAGAGARHSQRRGLSAGSASAAASAATDSLLSYGERVLRSPDPHDKVALTFECKARWDAGELPVFSGDRWTLRAPEQPARGAEPELLPPKRMPSFKQLAQRAGIPVAMLHALAHIELGAVDNYWDTLVRFEPARHELPRAFYDDFLAVASDEARHFRMVDGRLRELGARYGSLPATRALLEHAANTAADLAARIAVVPLVQEARGLDSGDRLVHRLQSEGDRASAAVVQQIVSEERGHVRCGVKWFHHIARVQGRGADPAAYFHELVLRFFPDGLPGPFNVEARLAADMDARWFLPLESSARARPSAARHEATAEAGAERAPEPSPAARVAAFAAGKKTVVLAGLVWPERTSSAAGVRSADLISILQEQGFRVLCASPSRPNEHTERLRRERGVECVQADANSPAFERLLRESSPQIVFFDRFVAEEMYGWQARQFAPEALRVLDLQDVHFLRKAREHLVKKQGQDAAAVLAAGADLDVAPVDKQALRELAAIHRSDLTLFVSDVERDMLVRRFQVPEHLLHRCAFFYPPADATASPAFDARRDVAFIGSFKHTPNVDAVEWTRAAILPLFRALSSGDRQPPPEIHIYGSYGAATRFTKMDDPARGFRVKGFAPDAHAMLQRYRLTIAPLRFGAGIKGKIADSWFAGTPCVATGIGAEGMAPPGVAWGGVVADAPDELAAAIHALYHDRERWADAQRAGVSLCNALYSREANAERFLARLDDALRRKTADRERNWTGRILWSERYRATEYMSRYIRAKNAGPSAA